MFRQFPLSLFVFFFVHFFVTLGFNGRHDGQWVTSCTLISQTHWMRSCVDTMHTHTSVHKDNEHNKQTKQFWSHLRFTFISYLFRGREQARKGDAEGVVIVFFVDLLICRKCLITLASCRLFVFLLFPKWKRVSLKRHRPCQQGRPDRQKCATHNPTTTTTTTNLKFELGKTKRKRSNLIIKIGKKGKQKISSKQHETVSIWTIFQILRHWSRRLLYTTLTCLKTNQPTNKRISHFFLFSSLPQQEQDFLFSLTFTLYSYAHYTRTVQ